MRVKTVAKKDTKDIPTVTKRLYTLRNSSTPKTSVTSYSINSTSAANQSPIEAKPKATVQPKLVKRLALPAKVAGRQINQKSILKNNTKVNNCNTRSKTSNVSTEKVVVNDDNEIVDGSTGSRSQPKAIRPVKSVANVKKLHATNNTTVPKLEADIELNSEIKTKRKRTKKRYLCQVCNKEFLGGNDLRKHIRIHTDERPYICQHCNKRFRQGGCLKNHIASQHGTSQTFICYYCNKAFPIKERLRLHLRLHSGEKPYKCTKCGKGFARGGQLTQHAATHNGLRKYHCSQCSSSFSCSMNLKLHLKGHLNERDYTCHMCGKSFIRPDALKKHLSCFHENVKAFYCHICSRTFKGHLPQHMRTHENVKTHACSSCGATFSQKSQLIVHHRIHSGERPYRCQVCWQAFAHSSVLKLHIRKHTGEKPFKCMMCKDETAFSQLPHLKTHMRTIHGMDKAYKCDGCAEFFKTKHDLSEHRLICSKVLRNEKNACADPSSSYTQDNSMSLSKMRLLVAVLLKKISTQDRLKQLGFDKRLIDNVLVAALQSAKQPICEDKNLTEAERLRINVKQFLEWTVPDAFMKRIKREQRSPEELLEDLTSSLKKKDES